MLFSCPGKEPPGGCNVTPFAQEKVDDSVLFLESCIAGSDNQRRMAPSGVIARHLVMPGLLQDTGEIVRWLPDEFCRPTST